MFKNRDSFINQVPRLGLAIVFLWFGLDKFIIHNFYVSWFVATERVQWLFPIDDPSLVIYSIGIAELILAILLFIGKKQIVVGTVVSFSLILIMATAQFPSSFPQDIALLGVSALIAFTGGHSEKNRLVLMKKHSWVLKITIAIVLVLWAADLLTNTERHLGWMRLSNEWFSNLGSEEQKTTIFSVSITELVLAATLLIPQKVIRFYAPLAALVFFGIALVGLSPPSNNHQTLSMALTCFWLTYSVKK